METKNEGVHYTHDSPLTVRDQLPYSLGKVQSNQAYHRITGAIVATAYRYRKSLSAALALFVLTPFGLQAFAFETPFEEAYAPSGIYSQAGFHFLVREGITGGGDRISGITFPNGTEGGIGAGGAYQIGMGTRYQMEVVPLSLALSVNYHYDSEHNEYDDASFRRVPLEALVYYELPGNLRLGTGIRYIHSARATSTINGVSEKIAFKNTKGSVVEIGYHVAPYGWADLRYVKETYQIESYSSSGETNPAVWGNAPYNGSHIGLFVTFEN
jgi:hypothetical protein